MYRPESIVITGGGTGGHIYPALALIQTLNEKWPEIKINFIGAISGIEKDLCEKAGVNYEGISCMKIRRRLSIENLLVIPTLIMGIKQASRLLNKYDPELVIGMGGYVTAPVILAALMKKKRCILHEQNSIPGLTNRWLAKRVERIITTYPSAHTALSNQNIFPAGIPIRREALAKNYPVDYKKFGLKPDIFTILIFGGSGGAKRLNEITVETFRLLEKDQEVQGLLLTGKRDYQYILSKNPTGNLKCMEHLGEMGRAYKIANLVVARGGAVSIAEITANGLPSILVPFPYATGDHQRLNILPLFESGGCKMELDKNLTAEKLAYMITELKENPSSLEEIARASAKWSKPNVNETGNRSFVGMIRNIFEKYKQIHFIGIGGIGMSALAQICHRCGMNVTGSDIKENNITTKLEEMGINISLKHDASNLGTTEAVVFSSAINGNNPELKTAKEKNIAIFHRSEVLEEIICKYKSIAVSGTHGKTTVSAMIAWTLYVGGMDPTSIIGGYVEGLGGNARIGDGEWLVAEADESDGSFLNLYPNIIVITNIELDHVDYYKNSSQVEEVFEKFLSENLLDGWAVLYRDDPRVVQIAKDCDKNIRWYGTHNKAYYRLVEYTPGTEYSKATIAKNGKLWGKIKLKIPGRTNAINSLAALATGDILGLEFDVMAKAIESFTGVQRRQEFKGSVNDITVIDDYAHHPTEIQLTLEALRERHAGRQVVIFQPHRYSRTMQMAEEFAGALKQADVVVITDVYSAGEKVIEGVSGRNIFDYGKDKKNWFYMADEKTILKEFPSLLKPGDVVITMGAGDINKWGEKLLEKLRKEKFHTSSIDK